MADDKDQEQPGQPRVDVSWLIPRVAYVPVEPNREYEFSFKLKKQFLTDPKYPTTPSPYDSDNNIIITELHFTD